MSFRLFIKTRSFVFFIIIILIGSFYVPISLSKKADQPYKQSTFLDEGQILYSPCYNTATYLRENTGTLNHTWSSSFMPGVMVRWFGDGIIYRTIRVGVGPGGGGAGGGIQKVLWDGTVVWDFRYNTNGLLSHHDLRILPNGNVLLIAWETKTRTECINAGRNPNLVTTQGLMPDHIIEVKPTDSSSGEIVWEWHVWDHLIQDYDFSKANYGVVEDHPELVDINYVTSTFKDLMHTNSIDYNEEFDQILISIRYYNEIWIIDHSTTTAEAASHTGGNYGKGGDLLYRWGNPQAYDRGTSSNRKLYEQHDTQWIDKGYPGEGNILIFNNGVSRGYSTVDEITPPADENGTYYIESDEAFGPTSQTWIYKPTPSFYASHISGANRLKNGNTLICNGETGKLFEVTSEGSTVWQYSLGAYEIFKVDYIPPEEPEPPEPNKPDLDCSGTLSWNDVKTGETVKGSFKVQNIGDSGSLLNWTINVSSIEWGTWTFTPESGNNLTPEDGVFIVQVSVVAPNEKETEYNGYIWVENKDNSTDFDKIYVYLKTPKNVQTINTIINNFILKIRNIFSEKLGIHLKYLGWF